jgi:hypothetical protein
LKQKVRVATYGLPEKRGQPCPGSQSASAVGSSPVLDPGLGTPVLVLVLTGAASLRYTLLRPRVITSFCFTQFTSIKLSFNLSDCSCYSVRLHTILCTDFLYSSQIEKSASTGSDAVTVGLNFLSFAQHLLATQEPRKKVEEIFPIFGKIPIWAMKPFMRWCLDTRKSLHESHIKHEGVGYDCPICILNAVQDYNSAKSEANTKKNL